MAVIITFWPAVTTDQAFESIVSSGVSVYDTWKQQQMKSGSGQIRQGRDIKACHNTQQTHSKRGQPERRPRSVARLAWLSKSDLLRLQQTQQNFRQTTVSPTTILYQQGRTAIDFSIILYRYSVSILLLARLSVTFAQHSVMQPRFEA